MFFFKYLRLWLKFGIRRLEKQMSIGKPSCGTFLRSKHFKIFFEFGDGDGPNLYRVKK